MACRAEGRASSSKVEAGSRQNDDQQCTSRRWTGRRSAVTLALVSAAALGDKDGKRTGVARADGNGDAMPALPSTDGIQSPPLGNGDVESKESLMQRLETMPQEGMEKVPPMNADRSAGGGGEGSSSPPQQQSASGGIGVATETKPKKKPSFAEIEQIRGELAEKELLLLSQSKELQQKEQTLMVLQERLEIERRLRELLIAEKEKAMEEAALARGFCGISRLP